VPWDIAVGADLAFPQIPGPRPAKVRLINSYLPRLHHAATRDDKLATALVRVIGLKDRPQTLLRPDRVIRVLHGNLAADAVCAAPKPAKGWPSGGGGHLGIEVPGDEPRPLPARDRPG